MFQKHARSLRFVLTLVVFLFLTVIITNSGALRAIQEHEIRQNTFSPTETLKLSITKAGVYQIKLSDLGWQEIDPSKLLVTNRGQMQPIWLTGQDSGEIAINFYGQPSASIYTVENVYLLNLSESPSPQLAVDMSTLTDAPHNSALTTIHWEENNHYSPVIRSGDHWLWKKFAATSNHSVEIDLPYLAPGDAAIRVELWGNTSAPADPDHHVQVWINDQMIADQYWDGQIRYTLNAVVPNGILSPQDNHLEIIFPGDIESVIEIAFLDWFEIDYQREMDLSENQVRFSLENEAVEFSNFEDPVTILDVSTPPTISVSSLNQDFPAFSGESDHQYFAVSKAGYSTPAKIDPIITEPDLHSQSMGAEYLIIGPEKLLAPSKPLLDWRKSQGLSVMSIPVHILYDQFNYGIQEPEAIQQFLKFAVQTWDPAPKYVFLIGDTTYDFKGYTDTLQSNLLPSPVVYTAYGGETVSDVLLAQINEDPWPDVSIGRIPAQTPEQVSIYIEKLIKYEQQDYDRDWHQRILAVADGQEPRFKHDGQFFIDQFSGDYQTTLLSPQAGAESTSGEIVNYLNQGSFITAYFGHGSLTMWGKDQLFTIDDIANISNSDRLPIMIHATCLTGLFTHPAQDSLVEKLLWHTKGGAVAVLAPTSLTLPGAQGFLTQAFVEELMKSPNTRLGDITLYAWRQVDTEYSSSRDVMNTFLLFGDPALQIPSPDL